MGNFVWNYNPWDAYVEIILYTPNSTVGDFFGGDSSSDDSYTPTYPPVFANTVNGSVIVSPKYPTQGVTVTITPEPENSYKVGKVTVIDKTGYFIPVKDNGDGTYTFTQSAGKVTVSVIFVETDSGVEPAVNPFMDVSEDAFYYDAVLWALENGVTAGINEDGTLFSPNAPCTRAQAATFLWRAAGCPEPKSPSSFMDVSADAYYAKAVAWAVENGITVGTDAESTTFSPDTICSRAQIVTFLWRALAR